MQPRDNWTVLTQLAVRLIYAIQAHPALRIGLGLLVAAVGVIALVAGGGHGGLIVVGVVLVAGGVTAAIAPRGSRPR
jgi:predicted phage tail protein